MTRTFKTLLSAAVLLTIAAPATAGDTFTARFNYDANATAEVNLASFKQTASKVCADQLKSAGYSRTDSTSFAKRKCEQGLVKSAVASSKASALIGAYAAATVKTVNGTKSKRRGFVLRRTAKPSVTKMASK